MEEILKEHLRKHVVDKTTAEGIIEHVEGVEKERDEAEAKYSKQSDAYKQAAETNQKKANTLRVELDETRRKVADNNKAKEQVGKLTEKLSVATAEIDRLNAERPTS